MNEMKDEFLAQIHTSIHYQGNKQLHIQSPYFLFVSNIIFFYKVNSNNSIHFQSDNQKPRAYQDTKYYLSQQNPTSHKKEIKSIKNIDFLNYFVNFQTQKLKHIQKSLIKQQNLSINHFQANLINQSNIL
ncbi:hypothetical protein ABPG74_008289 [Tetrahymena malaccensis]